MCGTKKGPFQGHQIFKQREIIKLNFFRVINKNFLVIKIFFSSINIILLIKIENINFLCKENSTHL